MTKFTIHIRHGEVSIPFNFCLKMMRQCSKLRQGKVVVNLMVHSLPDRFEMGTEIVKGRDDKEYTNYIILDKKKVTA